MDNNNKNENKNGWLFWDSFTNDVLFLCAEEEYSSMDCTCKCLTLKKKLL